MLKIVKKPFFCYSTLCFAARYLLYFTLENSDIFVTVDALTFVISILFIGNFFFKRPVKK